MVCCVLINAETWKLSAAAGVGEEALSDQAEHQGPRDLNLEQLCGCFYKLGVLIIRALLFGVCIRALILGASMWEYWEALFERVGPFQPSIKGQAEIQGHGSKAGQSFGDLPARTALLVSPSCCQA